MRILVAEDNPVFQIMLSSLLSKWGYEAVLASAGDEAWRILQGDGAPQLAILDWMMPGMDGVDICRRIRAAGREPYVYILLLTARSDSDDLVVGIEAGADDYLTKPFRSQELRARLRAGRRILDLQEQLLVAREALRRQATHDGLTGLLNRTSVLEILNGELARSGREDRPLAVLMIDLDRFKQINDAYGHLAGDAVLSESAQLMRAGLRNYDAIGRYGGEEFLVVLPGCDLDAAYARAERLRASIGSMPVRFGENTLSATCSIGVSWRREACASLAGTLIQEADRALYAAKGSGRNRVSVFNCDFEAAAV